MKDRPKPPKTLGKAGRKVWEDVLDELSVSSYLPAHEMLVLEQAARQADLNQQLEDALTSEGITVRGASGQWRLNGAATELRQGRLAVAKLLSDVGRDVRVEREDDEFDALLRGESP